MTDIFFQTENFIEQITDSPAVLKNNAEIHIPLPSFFQMLTSCKIPG
jgi:hypothetical protein